MEHQNKKKGEIEWSTSQVCKLSSLKTPLRKLLHDRCNLHANVSALREELHGIQHQIDVHPEDLLARKAEVDLLQKFQLASLDEELFLKQKSKINWLKVGDANTRFFHNVANIKVEETAPGVATGMILSLRESLQSCKDALETCQSELEDAKLENQKWHSAFQKESFISTGSSVSVEPRVVVNYLQNLKSSEESLREQLDKAKKKEAAFIVTIAKREQEIADLKAAVRDLRSQLKPLSMQARRLLLDPAIHEEFMRLKNLVEEKDKKVKELQDNVAAVNFTPQSKMGKMLMAKCKTLQDENEEIGNQAKEGKIHELYTKLALQKAQNIELRSECEGLCKHMEELTNNVEISNETVLILEEKLSDKEAEIKRLRQQLQQYDTVEEKTETFAAANNNDIDEDVTVSMDLEPEPEPETEEL